MKFLRPTLMIAAATLAAAPALAAPNGNGRTAPESHASATCQPGAQRNSRECPAQKQSQKQAQKQAPVQQKSAQRQDHGGHEPRVGDRFSRNDDAMRVQNPGRHGLDPNGTYYRSGQQVIRIDPQTSQIIAIVGLATAILGG